MLQATDTVLNLLQTRLDKEETRQQFQHASLLALIGVLLTLGLLIDRQVTEELWACWDEGLMPFCEPYQTLQVFGVQIFLIVMLIILSTLPFYLLYRFFISRR